MKFYHRPIDNYDFFYFKDNGIQYLMANKVTDFCGRDYIKVYNTFSVDEDQLIEIGELIAHLNLTLITPAKAFVLKKYFREIVK